MIKEFLNLSAIDHAEGMFGIATERLSEICNNLHKTEDFIAENHESFSAYHANDDGSEGEGLHAGKVLEEVLKVAQTPQEELLMIFCLRHLIDNIIEKVVDIKFARTIIDRHPNATIITMP